MPANLPAEAKAAWLKVMEARTPEEKIRAIEEFLSLVPKHKGTEKLVKQMRRRMAELRREMEERREKERALRGGGRGGPYVAKDGDLQVAVVGPPSSGKTALLRCLTNVGLEPDDVPFSTGEPVPAMFVEDGVYVQLVKMPSVLTGERAELNSLSIAAARNADAVLLVVGADAGAGEAKALLDLFEEEGIVLRANANLVRVERRGLGGIQVVGGTLRGATLTDVKRLLNEYGIYHAVVRIWGEATLEDVEEALYVERQHKPALAVVSRPDLADPAPVAAALRGAGLRVQVADLARCRLDRGALLADLLEATGRIRVFTKRVHSRTYEGRPIVLPRGSTVRDAVEAIHSSLLATFKYAVVWRRESFPERPKRVGLDYQLADGDVLEVHA